MKRKLKKKEKKKKPVPERFPITHLLYLTYVHHHPIIRIAVRRYLGGETTYLSLTR